MNRKQPVTGPAITRAVMSRIERARFRPGGHIMPQELAQKLGTSTTPVREALCQLVGRDILVERHREGFYVASVNSETLRSLYAAHGWAIETILHRWHAKVRLGGSPTSPWRIFAAVAAAIGDDALAGMQRYLAGRLAIARKYEIQIVSKTAAPELLAALRSTDTDSALSKSRFFHRSCEAAASQIWQSMFDT